MILTLVSVLLKVLKYRVGCPPAKHRNLSPQKSGTAPVDIESRFKESKGDQNLMKCHHSSLVSSLGVGLLIVSWNQFMYDRLRPFSLQVACLKYTPCENVQLHSVRSTRNRGFSTERTVSIHTVSDSAPDPVPQNQASNEDSSTESMFRTNVFAD